MARPKSGEVVERELTDGSISYGLRVRVNGSRTRVHLGKTTDGWTRGRAETELTKTLALIAAGAWSPPESTPEPVSPTFHEFATAYLASRRGEVSENTYADYEWRLVCHLLPFFADDLVADIDIKRVDAYRQHKVAEREEIKALAEADTPLCDGRGQRVRPLSNESINKTLAMLAAILDLAIDHELLQSNPARGRRRRLKARRPKRPFLEPDEVRSLLDAAERLDRRTTEVSEKARRVVALRAAGESYPRIAREIGISLSHAHYLNARATRDVVEPVLHRRIAIAILVGAGLRVSEACALRWRDIDLKHGRITVRDAKTEAGVREVRATPWLVEQLIEHRRRLLANGHSIKPGTPVLVTATGRPRDRKNVCDRIVKKAAEEADKARLAAGDPPLPEGITPHALRCTYISILLEAGAPLPYVMAQVGHEDESTTLGIYARVLRRKSREPLDEAFDEVLAA